MAWSHTFGSLSGSIPLSYLDDNFNDAAQLSQMKAASGFRNLIINGNFNINQREYVSGTATTAANQYTLDRWYIEGSGDSVTFAASGNGNEITIGSGVNFSQKIEDVNILGGKYTLSWTGTATATVGGTAVTNGDSITLTANTQTTVTFTDGTLSQVQLEQGEVATSFEQRPKQVEESLCQYYFLSVGYDDNGASAQSPGYCATTTIVESVFYFPRKMRAIPTFVVPDSTDFVVQQGATPIAVVTISSDVGKGKISFVVTATVASGLTVGQGCFIRAGNIAARFNFDAEL